MKRLIFFLMIFSFGFLLAQQNEGIKLQNEKESGFINVDKSPELIKLPNPVYPEEARMQAIEGKVFVKILVDENGNAVKSKIEKGVNTYLDKSALDAAAKAKFSPALVKNKAVKVWVVLPIAFKLSVDKKQEQTTDMKNNKGGKDDFPDPDDIVPVDKSPEVLNIGEPVYPEEAINSKTEGKVYVKVLVDLDGNASKAMVIKSDNDVFNKSATDAAMATKFKPAYHENKPMATWVVLPFKYKLDNLKK